MAQISKSLRFEILRRDGFACQYCGVKAPDAILHIDHVIPVALGGSDDASNLVAACQDCNIGKGKTPLDAETVAEVDADAERWAAAMDQARLILDDEIRQEEQARDWFESEWYNEIPRAYLPSGWWTSVKKFISMSVPPNAIHEAIVIAGHARHINPRDKFAYFCGVVNNMQRRIVEQAAELVEQDGGQR